MISEMKTRCGLKSIRNYLRKAELDMIGNRCVHHQHLLNDSSAVVWDAENKSQKSSKRNGSNKASLDHQEGKRVSVTKPMRIDIENNEDGYCREQRIGLRWQCCWCWRRHNLIR